MRYKLFLSDFDGTLVRGDGTISKENIEAIGEYRRRGGIFAVVTGRMVRSILPRLKELGLKEGLVVAYQGGTIADIATGTLLKADGFSPEQAAEAIRFLGDEHIHAYIDDELFVNRSDEFLKMYEKTCGVRGRREERLADFVLERGRPVAKVLVMIPPERRAALFERCKALGEGYTVTASAGFLVEILPAGVSKAQAVDFLAAHYGLSLGETAAIGDQLNDLPMIRRAGGGFAVANAEEEVRSAALIVASCEENGVKEALEIAMGD